MNKDIRQRLINELKDAPSVTPAKPHLNETIRLSRIAYVGRRKMRHIGTLEIITSQLRFVALPVWFLQGIALLCLCVFIGTAMLSEQFVSNLPAFASISAVFISMTALPVYGRSRRYKMHEIESTMRISHTRLILAKLCAIGIGDMVCLAVLILLIAGKMTHPAQTILIFILMPFLLSCALGLFIQNHMKEQYSIYASTGLGISIGAVCWTMAAKLQPALTQISIGLALAACAVLLLVLYTQCRRLMRQIPSSDMQETIIF